MNHAPGGMANAVPVPPVLIEGRLRVGFVATRDIPAGSEILWDYGVRSEPWLCKPGNILLTLKLCSEIQSYDTFNVAFIAPVKNRYWNVLINYTNHPV